MKSIQPTSDLPNGGILTLIDETLTEQGKNRWRRGTLLIPGRLIWLVLVLTLRRDLNDDQALNGMVSGFRGLADVLPAQAKRVSDGAIRHACVKLGGEVFRVLWNNVTRKCHARPAGEERRRGGRLPRRPRLGRVLLVICRSRCRLL